MIVTGICIYAAGLVFNEMPLMVRLVAKLLLIASFPLLLYWFGFYESIELERLDQFWTKWRNPLRWGKNFRKK